MEDAPRQLSLYECAMVRLTLLGESHSKSTAAYFEHFGYFPIPLKPILSPLDRRLLRLPCDCCIFGRCDTGYFISGNATWRVYCCGEQAGQTLQGLCRSSIFLELFKMCIAGTAFDAAFPFYRRELSKLSTRYLYYVGSVYVNNVHLLYFTNYIGVNNIFLKSLISFVWGDIYLGNGLDDKCVIIPCYACAELGEAAVSRCLLKVKEMMMWYLTCLPNDYHYRCGLFQQRDKLIQRVAAGEPVLRRVFDSWLFPSGGRRIRPQRSFYFP
ncbi:E4-3 [Deer mastadenovirus B]|uniref:E4-3 n=1 Tax=Deer mastadenovirus B TaxID=2170000 RepID=A0A1Y0B6I0_9ADEN|nr:E4-3 [Deer mastadenovirus B]ART33383.1 E4-3 [Deer mastadenovirus B]